jgi:uncharacterized protein
METSMKPTQAKTALITGASSGLGAEFARQLAAEGCDLILVARREDRLRALKEEIANRFGRKTDILSMDLAAKNAPQILFNKIKDLGLAVDVLINNAGLGLFGEFTTTPWDRTQQMLTVDILALAHLTRLFAPEMAARKKGWILMVASTGAFQPTPAYAAYAAAKSFVLSFGEALHYELHGTGVQCSVLCPGVTQTEFLEVAGQTPTLYQKMTMMDCPAVARIGLRALWSGRSSIVAGGINGIGAFFMRLLPRQIATALAATMMR